MKDQAGKKTVTIAKLGTWWVGRLARPHHCRIVNALANPTPRRFLDPATDWRGKAAGFPLHTGVEADAALLMNVRMPVRPWRQQRQLGPLRKLPARHRACDLRWRGPSLYSCQGRDRCAPLREVRSCRCEPRLDTGEPYHLQNTPKHSITRMFFLIAIIGLVPVTAQEADQVLQGGRREEHRGPSIRRQTSFQLRNRQICPVPKNRGYAPDAKSHQHLWCSLPPEDAPHATRLAAIGTVFRNNRHRTSAECNIRCCLSLA